LGVPPRNFGPGFEHNSEHRQTKLGYLATGKKEKRQQNLSRSENYRFRAD